MAAIDTVDPSQVPVREGEYGDRVATVEPGGVEYIPASERHGRPIQMFATWMSPNLEFATIFVGVLGVAVFGGSFWTVCLGIVIGTALGSTTHAILSSWGPKFGVPQMVQSRSAFGFWGNILPAGLMSITAGIGWFAVNSVSGTFALNTLIPAFPLWFCLVLIVLVQIVVAFFGHNLVHAFERYAFVPLVIVFAIASVIILSKANAGQGFNPKAPVAFGGEVGALLLTAAAAFGYAAGWNPYASDYTRYYPANADRRAIALWAGGGIFVSCVVLEIVGAASATLVTHSTNPTTNFTSYLPGFIGGLTLLCIAIGAVSANVLNIYSGAMAFLTLGIKLPMALRRAIVALAFGCVGFVVALIGTNGYSTKYENFLLVIAYWIAPWLAVVFTDYLIRRGDIQDRDLYDRRRQNWAGPIAMLVGMVVSIYLFSNQTQYVGPVANNAPQLGDLTFVVGFVISAVVYFALYKVLRPRTAAASS
jgi:NCS1 family nucleobase:cation symporter-1